MSVSSKQFLLRLRRPEQLVRVGSWKGQKVERVWNESMMAGVSQEHRRALRSKVIDRRWWTSARIPRRGTRRKRRLRHIERQRVLLRRRGSVRKRRRPLRRRKRPRRGRFLGSPLSHYRSQVCFSFRDPFCIFLSECIALLFPPKRICWKFQNSFHNCLALVVCSSYSPLFVVLSV